MSFNISGSPSISGASLLNATSCKRGRASSGIRPTVLTTASVHLLHGRDEQKFRIERNNH